MPPKNTIAASLRFHLAQVDQQQREAAMKLEKVRIQKATLRLNFLRGFEKTMADIKGAA